MRVKTALTFYLLIALKANILWAQDFFERIATERIVSDERVEWKNFGPGMSGYCEEFWCHPTDTAAMFMGPDMHVTYGTWDNGRSWQTVKDSDGDGMDLERVNDMVFSKLNPDFGIAIERRGKVFKTTDRGRSWTLIKLLDHAAESPWYNAHSKAAIDPTDDNTWYIGAGGFWDVKANFRSLAKPTGQSLPIYAYGYILKTTDGGATWTKIANNIADNLDVGRIRINPNDPDSIVIATGHGMFLSTDAGATWNESSTGLPNNMPKDLAEYYNPNTKEYVLYTVEQSVYTENGNNIETSGGVFKSTDGGATWSGITGNLGLDFTAITDYTFRDKYANTVAYWLGKSKSYIKEKNYPTNTLQVFRRLVVDPNNKDVLYLVPNQRHDKSFGPGDIWKTENGGEHWKVVARHGTYWHAASDAAYWQTKGMVTTPNVEFAHLQESLDESHPSASANRMLAINAVGEVFIGINQQVHRSNNGGESWDQVDDYESSPGSNKWIGRGGSNLPGRFILHKTGIPDRRLLCSGEHGLWQTTSDENWPNIDDVIVEQIQGQVNDVNGNHDAHSISTVAVHPNNPNIIFILAWRQEHRGWLRKTTDGGKTWNNVVQLFDSDNGSWESTASQYSLLIDPNTPENMYFTAIYQPISCGTNSGPGEDLTMGEYGVYRSTNGGNTWTPSNQGLPSGASVNRIIMHPDNPETLYAALNQWRNNDPFGLYISTDKAATWSEVAIPSAISSVNNVFIDPNTKYIYISCGARSGANNAGGVYRSKDNGDTWEKFFTSPYVWHCVTSPVNPDIVFVNVARQAGSNGTDFSNTGLFLTLDDGENWMKINKGLGQPDKMVDLSCDPYNENILWTAGWGSGWFKAIIQSDTVSARGLDTEVLGGLKATVYGIASTGSQLEYKWTAPEGITLSSTDQYKTTFIAPRYENDSTITLNLRVNNSMDSDETEVKVLIKYNTSSVSSVNASNVKIYPNPVKDRLYIDNATSDSVYTLHSISGATLLTDNQSPMDISGVSPGCYVLNVSSKKGSSNHKIIVE